MSLLNVLRDAVKIADKITKPLQATVTYERFTGGGGFGEGSYGSKVRLRAIVDYKSVQVRTREGILTVTRATIDLLDVAAVVAATGGEGIGNDDRFTLPDGDTGPILDLGGFIDAGTGQPMATKVLLG